jgi:methionine synthase II (cobalamin-independent)
VYRRDRFSILDSDRIGTQIENQFAMERFGFELGFDVLESGNVRHKRKYKVWRDAKLSAEKDLIPGVVSHATDLVEHPELVADRVITFAELVGRENVIAGTDCRPGDRSSIRKSPRPSCAQCSELRFLL